MIKNNAFEIVKKYKIKERDIEVFEIRHKKSGAEILWIKNSDINKMFAISFLTLPDSDKGEAHILEHAVFLGSRKFDLGGKEIFAELARKRTSTYLNAYTMPDHTVYPVASLSGDDFYYLMDVYLDAVFYPKVLREKNIFKQEAWRIDKSQSGKYIFNGVVLGEMKSRLSSAKSIFYKALINKSFPNSVYKWEWGGDPDKIVDLSYRELVSFHKKFYNASNARVYLYGKLNINKALALLDEYLSANIGKSYEVSVKTPKRKREEKIYLPGRASRDSALSLSFYMEDSANVKENLILHIIFDYLTGDKSSPVQEAFYRSGIKASPVFEFEKDLKVNTANFIFFGANKKDLDKLVALVFESLDRVKKEGLDRKLLKKKLNFAELAFARNKYITRKDIQFLHQIMSSWSQGASLQNLLDKGKLLREIETEFEKDPEYFDKFFDKYFYSAKNYFVLKAEAKKLNLFEELKRKEKSVNKANKKEKEKFDADIKEYKAFKEQSEYKALPASNLSKYKFTPKDYTKEVEKLGNIYFKKINSNLVSAEIIFDLSHLDARELQALSVLIKSFDSFDFENLSRKEMDFKKEGIITGPKFYIKHVSKNKKAKSFLKVSFSFLKKNEQEAKEILESYLYKIKVNTDILKKDLQESFEHQKDALRYFTSAKLYAQTRALAPFLQKYANLELTEGISFLVYEKELLDKWESESKIFAELYKKAFEGKAYITLSARVLNESFFEFLKRPKKRKSKTWKNPFKKENVYFFVPHKGFYTNALASSARISGDIDALTSLVNFKYLWETIREQGGAYGAYLDGFVFDELVFLESFSDPHQKRTYDIFERIDDFDMSGLDKSDTEGAKASNLSLFDMPEPETSKAYDTFLQDMTDWSFSKELQRRKEMLGANKESLYKTLRKVKEAIKKENVKISLGGSESPEMEFDKIIKLDL